MKKVCSFCGRGERDVQLLITGLNGYIFVMTVQNRHIK